MISPRLLTQNISKAQPVSCAPASLEKHHLVANRFRRMLLVQPHDTPDHFSNRASFLVPVENTYMRLAWGYR